MIQEMLFISLEKLFSAFCPGVFGLVGKQLVKKANVNFKIYEVLNWETNNYNAHIAQYLKK